MSRVLNSDGSKKKKKTIQDSIDKDNCFFFKSFLNPCIERKKKKRSLSKKHNNNNNNMAEEKNRTNRSIKKKKKKKKTIQILSYISLITKQ